MVGSKILQKSRWEILTAISQGHASATDIAKRTGGSMPNITQQLQLLAAYDVITQDKELRSGVGKPRQLYRIKRPVAHLALAREGQAVQTMFTPNESQALLLSVLTMKTSDAQIPILKLMLTEEELLKKCSIAVKSISSQDIELLLLTEDVDKIRKEYSKIETAAEGKKWKFIAWTHSIEEVKEGLSKGEQHFEMFKKTYHLLHDPQGRFQEVWQ
ncbi:hypothetical protein GOV11_04575 [Candidatus Woesearchaeota archaeon]|nr:hypothetical protein [Candidatus Woesearchaeota archaeon]